MLFLDIPVKLALTSIDKLNGSRLSRNDFKNVKYHINTFYVLKMTERPGSFLIKSFFKDSAMYLSCSVKLSLITTMITIDLSLQK